MTASQETPEIFLKAMIMTHHMLNCNNFVHETLSVDVGSVVT